MSGCVVADPLSQRAVVIRDQQQNVAMVAGAATRAVVVRDRPQTAVVISGFQGPRGSQGAPGDSSDARGRAVVAFAFGDASPAPIFTPVVNCTDVLVRVVIDTPFDGAGAALSLGTAADPDSLMPAVYNDPATAGGYEAAPDVALAAGVPVVLTINAGSGASKGAGRIIFDSINS